MGRLSPTIDPARLARAVRLDARPETPGTWLVTGGAEPHTVTTGRRWDCDCTDRGVRRVPCKHILRVALAQGHPAVLRALREVVS